jgi:hypothetical protein
VFDAEEVVSWGSGGGDGEGDGCHACEGRGLVNWIWGVQRTGRRIEIGEYHTITRPSKSTTKLRPQFKHLKPYIPTPIPIRRRLPSRNLGHIRHQRSGMIDIRRRSKSNLSSSWDRLDLSCRLRGSTDIATDIEEGNISDRTVGLVACPLTDGCPVGGSRDGREGVVSGRLGRKSEDRNVGEHVCG